MPNERRPVRRPVKRQANNKEANGKLNWRLAQLLICLVILGAVLITRAFKPEAVQAFVLEHIQNGIELEDTLAYIGEGFKSIFVQVPTPEASPELEPSVSPSPDPSSSSTPSGSSEPDEGLGETSPALLLQSQLGLLAMGGFDEPLRLPEEFLPFSDEFEEDDTLPLPFGMEKPEKADYNVYELPFETTLPLKGEVTSGFGYRVHPIDGVTGFHYGLDIAANTGTKIAAFAEGTVIAAGESSSYGKYVMIRHDNEYVTLYAHCSKIMVKEGQSVKKGAAIAKVGSTGKATGPHLHFEIRKGNSLLNPEYFINPEN